MGSWPPTARFVALLLGGVMHMRHRGFHFGVIVALSSVAVSACGEGGTSAPQPIASIVVSPSSAQLSALQQTTQLTATARTASGSSAAATFTWVSSSPDIASVDANGMVRAVANGTARITASSGAISGGADVIVRQAAARVQLATGGDSIVAGTSRALTAAATDAGNASITTPEVIWTSSDLAVATVSATGVLTARARGQTRITARVDTATASSTVFVRLADLVPGRDTSIAGVVSVRRLEIAKGRTLRLTAHSELRVDESATIDGAVVGDCVAIRVHVLGALVVRGRVDDGCTGAPSAATPVRLVAGGSIMLDSATITGASAIVVTNDTTLQPPPSGTTTFRRRTTASVAQPCNIVSSVIRAAGAPRAKSGAAGSPKGVDGDDGAESSLGCTGTLTLRSSVVRSQSGGDGGQGSSTPGAKGEGGTGGDGGAITIFGDPQLTLDAVAIVTGDGGAGGPAKGGGNGTMPRADGKTGGLAGVPLFASYGRVDVLPGGVDVTLGSSGEGGSATAEGARGTDSSPSAAATAGESATAFAAPGVGLGGLGLPIKIIGDVFRGVPSGQANIRVGGAKAGRGGDASAAPGNGGDGTNKQFPNGAAGGDVSILSPGAGGDVQVLDNSADRNTWVGTPGNSGDGFVDQATGGAGFDNCVLPVGQGGRGGLSGTWNFTSSRPGTSGNGQTGTRGTITIRNALDGGPGGDGVPVGAGGGVKQGNENPPPFAEVLMGVSKALGPPGKPCGLTLTGVSIVTPAGGDPSDHEMFGKLKNTTQLQLGFGAGNSVTVSGNANWPSFTGGIDAAGQLMVNFTGSYAGFTGIGMRFVGRVTMAPNGAPTGLDGTLEVGIDGKLPGGQKATYIIVASP
jgi:hypothetical protein